MTDSRDERERRTRFREYRRLRFPPAILTLSSLARFLALEVAREADDATGAIPLGKLSAVSRVMRLVGAEPKARNVWVGKLAELTAAGLLSVEPDALTLRGDLRALVVDPSGILNTSSGRLQDVRNTYSETTQVHDIVRGSRERAGARRAAAVTATRLHASTHLEERVDEEEERAGEPDLPSFPEDPEAEPLTASAPRASQSPVDCSEGPRGHESPETRLWLKPEGPTGTLAGRSTWREAVRGLIGGASTLGGLDPERTVGAIEDLRISKGADWPDLFEATKRAIGAVAASSVDGEPIRQRGRYLLRVIGDQLDLLRAERRGEIPSAEARTIADAVARAKPRGERANRESEGQIDQDYEVRRVRERAAEKARKRGES